MELLDTTFFLTHENFRAELCCVFVSEKKIVLSLQFGLLLRPVRLLISHVLFSQNKSATSNQSAVLFSQNKSVQAISHQPNEQAAWPCTVQHEPIRGPTPFEWKKSF
jgi:hypothetical protein